MQRALHCFFNKVVKGSMFFVTPDSRFPIPDSRFPIPDSRFPTPYSLLPTPYSLRIGSSF
ncbi:hypothetical protein [Moorena bouillonii]|uniref:hypothetical protein n=1 Tax=Moorena bouillonii TaxID=207920 RepID=UPI00117EE329|nr:hypothetical protein [Moorena bouillonii]